ncbi:hypothetical protein [Paraburkholderia kirstenboschensis]|uniref:Uracil-DNA glycosylase-like domain-containing protein n=1 Tax=Paraburkholderia kirstenboschensis TaxID=1245436 RepID=A0ABZ0EL11_9BURK|nr:hypothetical protein [Paraburkholderia kirstenboschensis]WOD17012.1 hypothetical protein RW095_14305 [Paraburkholderia kirstenboschensis]
MSNVIFMPWIGSKYETEGFRGLRVLIVAESHYGSKRSERPTATPELVKALGQRLKHPDATARLRKHPHFARIVTAVSDAACASRFTTQERADFWERVCYYNFLQDFMPAARVAPPAESWDVGKAAFLDVLGTLQPDVVIAFSKRLSPILKPLCGSVPLASVHHPSTGFSYARWNPVIANAFDEADARRRSSSVGICVSTQNPVYTTWYEASRSATPAHGPYVSGSCGPL